MAIGDRFSFSFQIKPFLFKVQTELNWCFHSVADFLCQKVLHFLTTHATQTALTLGHREFILGHKLLGRL